jgi:hypothetical protein
MPGLGIAEIVALLLGLSSFSLHPNPKPATADAALAYAMPEADVVLHVDVASIVPGNYKLLTDLPNLPNIKASPEMAKGMRELVANVEGGRGMVKTLTGIDLATDVTDATAFVQLVPQAKPNLLVEVHGKFSPANVEKVAKLTGATPVRVGSVTMAQIDPKFAAGVTRDGVLLVGATDLVRTRLDDGWKAPAHAAGTALGYAAEMIDKHPVIGASVTLSATGRDALQWEGLPGFHMIARSKSFSLALLHDGLGWTWVDSTKAGFESITQMSDGFVDLLRAAQIAPRGFAKIAIASLEGQKSDPQLDELLKHKDELLKLVTSLTGDGQFKVTKNADAGKLRLDVRATGKTASEVVPAGAFIPLMAIGFVVGRSEVTKPMLIPAPATKAPAPAPKAPAPPLHR